MVRLMSDHQLVEEHWAEETSSRPNYLLQNVFKVICSHGTQQKDQDVSFISHPKAKDLNWAAKDVLGLDLSGGVIATSTHIFASKFVHTAWHWALLVDILHKNEWTSSL